jgi:hypothetical protein
MAAHKEEIITFKADTALADALKLVPNRSDFIRNALLRAFENVCPLCQGTGLLTTEQKQHWEIFAKHHEVRKCTDCKAVVLTCDRDVDGIDA